MSVKLSRQTVIKDRKRKHKMLNHFFIPPLVASPEKLNLPGVALNCLYLAATKRVNESLRCAEAQRIVFSFFICK